MKYFIVVSLFLISIFSQTTFAQNKISIGEKFSIESKILNEQRFFNVYTPPSYGTLDKVEYPVIYLMDGDYNFHYVTGLIEQLSGISEKIPEVIVVGISDNGKDSYIKNCTPYDEKSNPNGQSEKFLEFLNKELKTHIDKHYSVADYSIIIGHSAGGLFVVNALLSKPDYFDTYIAISPSLWWNDYGTKDKIKPFFEKHENLNKHFYLSLGNEKGMGVFGFIDQLDINTFADEYYGNEPLGLKYTFNHFKNENHNSVGLVSLDFALKDLFKKYDIPNDRLNNIKDANDLFAHYKSYLDMIGAGFRIPTRQLNYIAQQFHKNNRDLKLLEKTVQDKFPASLGDYFNSLGNIYVKAEKVDEGIKTLLQNVETNPNCPDYLTSLAKAYSKNKDPKSAKLYFSKALDLAKKQNARNWQLNQFKANLENTE